MTKSIITVLQLAAAVVLPKAKPEQRELAMLGCIPNTIEWFVFKTSLLDPDDEEGLEEWADYLEEKLEERKGVLNGR